MWTTTPVTTARKFDGVLTVTGVNHQDEESQVSTILRRKRREGNQMQRQKLPEISTVYDSIYRERYRRQAQQKRVTRKEMLRQEGKDLEKEIAEEMSKHGYREINRQARTLLREHSKKVSEKMETERERRNRKAMQGRVKDRLADPMVKEYDVLLNDMRVDRLKSLRAQSTVNSLMLRRRASSSLLQREEMQVEEGEDLIDSSFEMPRAHTSLGLSRVDRDDVDTRLLRSNSSDQLEPITETIHVSNGVEVDFRNAYNPKRIPIRMAKRKKKRASSGLAPSRLSFLARSPTPRRSSPRLDPIQRLLRMSLDEIISRDESNDKDDYLAEFHRRRVQRKLQDNLHARLYMEFFEDKSARQVHERDMLNQGDLKLIDSQEYWDDYIARYGTPAQVKRWKRRKKKMERGEEVDLPKVVLVATADGEIKATLAEEDVSDESDDDGGYLSARGLINMISQTREQSSALVSKAMKRETDCKFGTNTESLEFQELDNLSQNLNKSKELVHDRYLDFLKDTGLGADCILDSPTEKPSHPLLNLSSEVFILHVLPFLNEFDVGYSLPLTCHRMHLFCGHDAIWSVLYKRRFGTLQLSIHARPMPWKQRYARRVAKMLKWRKRKIMCNNMDKASGMVVGPWKFFRDFAVVTNMKNNCCSIITTDGNFEYHRLDHHEDRVTHVEIVPWQCRVSEQDAPLVTLTYSRGSSRGPLVPPMTSLGRSQLATRSTMRNMSITPISTPEGVGISSLSVVPSSKLTNRTLSPVQRVQSHWVDDEGNRSVASLETTTTYNSAGPVMDDLDYSNDQGLIDRNTRGLDTCVLTATLSTDGFSYVKVWHVSREHSECVWALRHDRSRISVLTMQRKYNTTSYRASSLRVPEPEFGVENTEFVSASTDGLVKRWNAYAGRLMEETMFSGISIHSLQYDNTKYVVGGRAPVYWFDYESKKCAAVFEGHKGPVHCLQYDHSQLFTASKDRTIKIWDTRSSSPLLRSLSGTKLKEVTGLYADQFKIVASAGDMIYVWDTRTGRLLDTLVDSIGHKITGIQVDDEKLMLSLGSSKHQLKVYNLKRLV